LNIKVTEAYIQATSTNVAALSDFVIQAYVTTVNEKKTRYLKCAKKDIKIENLNIRSLYIE